MSTDDDSQEGKSVTQFDHDDYRMETGSSAIAIANLVYDYLDPTSVVDVGCGTGVFLNEFKKRGVENILGLDGPATRAVFVPDKSNFVATDLTLPVELTERFDLALCLEVAEHLPEKSADVLVKTLVDLAPVVLFSAAHPAQGGQDHINEHWPIYWHRRFSQHNYVALDILRGPLSTQPRVLDCYRWNTVFYVEFSCCAAFLDRAEELDVPDAFIQAEQDITINLQRQPWRDLVRTLARKLGRQVWHSR